MLLRIPLAKHLAWTTGTLFIALTLTKLVPWQATVTADQTIASGDIRIVALRNAV